MKLRTRSQDTVTKTDMIYRITVIVLLIASFMFAGCSSPEMTSKENDVKPQSTNVRDAGTSSIAKIAVLTDGSVFVNSERVSIDSLASKLDSIGPIKEIWYYREAPEASEPHENAMKAIEEIANRNLPIAMFRDRDFTKRLTF